MTTLTMLRLTTGALMLTLTAGCAGLGGKPPKMLLSLNAAATPAAGVTRTSAEGRVLTVLIPTAPQKLRTPRIPVQESAGSIAYIAGGQWVEAPARLFQRLLSDTIAARTNRLVLDEGQYLTAPGEQLAGQLLDFGVDEATGEAVVTYEAMVVAPGGKAVSQRRFTAREPAGGITAPNAGAALERAANRVAADVAMWVG